MLIFEASDLRVLDDNDCYNRQRCFDNVDYNYNAAVRIVGNSQS